MFGLLALLGNPHAVAVFVKPKNTIMKRNELLNHLSQYRAEINRLLAIYGNAKQIGYTLANGKTPELYIVHADKSVHNFHLANTGKDLLEAIILVHKTIQIYGALK